MKQLLVPSDASQHDIAQVHGPVELSLDELRLVGGGLPRGGWIATTTTTSDDDPDTGDLPRGGW